MRYLLFILVVVLGFGCSSSKEFPTSTQSVPKPTHIQPDTCLTDRQFRQYLSFVKDSMRIENRRIKIEYRFDNNRFSDSIKQIERTLREQINADYKFLRDSLRLAKVEVKQKSKAKKVEEKTKRVEVRQENRTERAKLNRLTIFVIGLVVGLVLPRLIRFIIKII